MKKKKSTPKPPKKAAKKKPANPYGTKHRPRGKAKGDDFFGLCPEDDETNTHGRSYPHSDFSWESEFD